MQHNLRVFLIFILCALVYTEVTWAQVSNANTLTNTVNCFDADAMKELSIDQSTHQQKAVDVLLYIWSPSMGMSITQAHLAKAAADKEGVGFLPLVDGRVSSKQWQATLAQSPKNASLLQNSKPLCHPHLIEKGAYRHFPMAYLFANNKLHPRPMVGAMPEHFWQQSLLERKKTCIPRNQFIALDAHSAGLDDNLEVALGSYERISPDGRYILRSFSGKELSTVSIVELPNATARQNANETVQITETPLSNEAFPVQGTWRYLVDTNGEHYTFADVLQKEKQAKPKFKGGMQGFYANAAELPSTRKNDDNTINIRSLSWPNANGRGDDQGQGSLFARTLTININKTTNEHAITKDSGTVGLCHNRLSVDGAIYALPMLSVDGLEIAALPQNPNTDTTEQEPTMRLFGLQSTQSAPDSDMDCHLRTQFKSQSGKVIFGFDGHVAYEYKGQIWWYHRGLAMPFNLAPSTQSEPDGTQYKNTIASAFPGITKDGRVIYAANWEKCTPNPSNNTHATLSCIKQGGYIVADPWQSHAWTQRVDAENNTKNTTNYPSCISNQDVETQRASFANLHGLSI